MRITFVAFNYKSGADIEAEEKHYLSYHLALAKKTAGVNLYYSGRLAKAAGKEPERIRAAILGFESAEAAIASAGSEQMMLLAADSVAHLDDLVMRTVDAEVIVPFTSRRPGQSCFVMAAEFGLEPTGGSEAAEGHYRDVHVGIARRLPGLRNYIIGKINEAGGDTSGRYRMAFLAFDTADALRTAYRSPVGQELVKDEEATIRNPRVYRLDARVEV